MPLFGSPSGADPDTEQGNHRTTTTTTSPKHKGSIFSHRRPTSSADSSIDHTAPTRKGFFSRRSSSYDHPHTTANHTGFFGRRSPSPEHHTNRTTSTRGGFFGRRSSSSDDSLGGRSGSRSTGGRRFFGDSDGPHRDPTILAARQKVTDAEEAEKDADRALSQARAMVTEARNHVKILEKEVAEEYVHSISFMES